MDNNILIGGSVIGALLFWWATKNKVPENVEMGEDAYNVPAFASQNFTTPGVLVVNPRFSQLPPQDVDFTTLNVTVKSPELSLLAQKYIPLFGFVGIAPATQAQRQEPIVANRSVYSPKQEETYFEPVGQRVYSKPISKLKKTEPIAKSRFLENNIFSWRSSLEHG